MVFCILLQSDSSTLLHMYPLSGLEDDSKDNTLILKDFAHSRIHEYDFIAIKTEKETSTIKKTRIIINHKISLGMLRFRMH